MSGPGRGRGRRDNGLRAALWSPLRDVDPRVGEHLLDLLETAGIAAYLEPSVDVGPYTRTVFLPSPPSDRLFVDRARHAEARALLEQHADDGAADRPPRAPARDHRPMKKDPHKDLRKDLDEDAEWAEIVAAFEAEHGRAVDTPSPEPPPAPTPPPHEPSFLDLPEEHYEPPPPPPLPVPAPASLYAVLLIALGVLLWGWPGLLRLSSDAGLVLGVAAIGGGAALLVSRMRDRPEDDGDDGAVV